MSKQEFLARLKIALAGLPKDEVDERLNFYSEMIDDRMEEGFSEEAAVAGVGSMGNIVTQAVSEVPIGKLVKERIKPKRSLSGGEVALIVLVFPLWFPLLVAFLAIVFSLYVTLFALSLSLWGVEVGFWGAAIGGVGIAVMYGFQGFMMPGLAALGVGLFAAGVAIVWIAACVSATKGIIKLGGKLGVGIKRLFIRKEKAE